MYLVLSSVCAKCRRDLCGIKPPDPTVALKSYLAVLSYHSLQFIGLSGQAITVSKAT